MIQSMTGYGIGVASSQNYRVTFELKSLNSKYFDFSIKLPQSYTKYEHKLRSYLAARLDRGKVSAVMNVEVLAEGKVGLNLNRILAKAYLSELKDLQAFLGVDGPINLEFLMGLPEVIPTNTSDEDPEEWGLIEEAMKKACKALIRTREEEGKALNNDLASRRESIFVALQEVEKLLPARKEHIRSRLNLSMDEIRHKIGEFDVNRFEQELIYYLEKQDINEEVVRLKQHLVYFKEIQEDKKSRGKQLQFIAQEMGREINTIGAKANDASIQRFVVKMKDELEKIKEQVLNLV